MARYRTVAIGTFQFEDLALDFRVVFDEETRRFRSVTGGALADKSYPTPQAAATAPPGVSVKIRSSLEPAGPDEVGCPICDMARPRLVEHPRAVCPVCVLHAEDENADALQFSDHLGVLRVRRATGPAEVTSEPCLIHGQRCLARARRLGGVVVELE